MLRKVMYGVFCILLSTGISISSANAKMLTPVSSWLVQNASMSSGGGATAFPSDYCLVSNEYDNGFILKFSGKNRSINNVLVNFRQNAFSVGSSYDITLAFSNGKSAKVSAKAVRADTLSIALPSSINAFNSLKNSYYMDVTLGKVMARMSLIGFDKASNDFMKCSPSLKNNTPVYEESDDIEAEHDLNYYKDNVTIEVNAQDKPWDIAPAAGENATENNIEASALKISSEKEDFVAPRRQKAEVKNVEVAKNSEIKNDDISNVEEDENKNSSEEVKEVKKVKVITSPSPRIIKDSSPLEMTVITPPKIDDPLPDLSNKNKEDSSDDLDTIGQIKYFPAEKSEDGTLIKVHNEGEQKDSDMPSLASKSDAALKKQVKDLSKKVEALSSHLKDADDYVKKYQELQFDADKQEELNNQLSSVVVELRKENEALRMDTERLKQDKVDYLLSGDVKTAMDAELKELSAKLDASEQANKRLSSEIQKMARAEISTGNEENLSVEDAIKRYKAAEAEVMRLGALMQKERAQSDAEIKSLEAQLLQGHGNYSSYLNTVDNTTSANVKEKAIPVKQDNVAVNANASKDVEPLPSVLSTKKDESKAAAPAVAHSYLANSSNRLWSAIGGTDIHMLMKLWGQEAKAKVVWNTDYDFPVRQDVEISGSFEDAVATVLEQYKGKTPRPIGKIVISNESGEKVLIIESGSS